MNREWQLVRAVAVAADGFYDEAMTLGTLAATIFRRSQAGRAQLSGLETIANSTLSRADVLDYIKKQTGRHEAWHKPATAGSNDRLGPRLLAALEGLDERIPRLEVQPPVDDTERRHVHLLLMQQFIRQVIAQYEYRRAGTFVGTGGAGGGA